MSGIAVPIESQIKYLQRRTAEISQIKSSLTSDPDWELVKKVGHQIKGNAATFGFAPLAEYGKSLEAAAAGLDISGVRLISGQLEQEVQRLLGALT